MTPESSLICTFGFGFAIAIVACGGEIRLSETSPDAQASMLSDASAAPVDLDAATSEEPASPAPMLLDAGTAPDEEGSAQAPGDARVDTSAETAASAAQDAMAFDDASEGSEDAAGGPYSLPSTAGCITGGHVLWVQGDPGCFWFTGTQTDGVGGDWFGEAEEYQGALVEVSTPMFTESNGLAWYFNFNTWNLTGLMQTGVRYDASVIGGTFLVEYGTKVCTSGAGGFRVDDYAAMEGDSGIGTLLSFTAAFAFTCDGSPGVLRGCIHF